MFKDNNIFFENAIEDLEKCNDVNDLCDILGCVRDHLRGIDGEKSIWKKIKNSFSRQSTTTELLEILDNLFDRFWNKKIDDDVKLFLAWVEPINKLPKRNGSRVPYGFIEAVGKVCNRLFVEKIDKQRRDIQLRDIQLNGLIGNEKVKIDELIEERREKMKDIKPVGSMKEATVQGSVDVSSSSWAKIELAKDNDGNEYSLKTIDVSKSKPGTHNLVRSEILACETLADLNCDYISKPIGYDVDKDDCRKAKVAYKISKGLLGTYFIKSIGNELDNYKKFKATPLGAKCFQLIMKQLISAVEELHSKGVHHGNLGGESFKIDVNGNSVDNLKVSLKVINFGYCYKIRGISEYNKDDFLEHCHPVVSIIMFYYVVRNLAYVLVGKTYAKELQDKVYSASGKLLESLIESAKEQYYCPYEWRTRYLNKATMADVMKCDEVFEAIKKWSNSQLVSGAIFEPKNNS